MNLKLIDGGANTPLSELVAGAVGVGLCKRVVGRFPDGEAQVQLLERVAGDDVFILQPTSAPPDERLMELLLLADAARRGGAVRVTVVIPYFGYARQDHDGGRPIAASLIPRMIEVAGVSQVIAIDLHSRSVDASFGVPVQHLTAVPLLVERLADVVPRDSVIVAPDLGATKLADRYASMLRLPVAFVRKERSSGTEVEVHGVTGDVRKRTAVIVDDMISTGGTIVAAAEACREAGANEDVFVAATHLLLAGDASERLERMRLRSLLGTDSIMAPGVAPSCTARVSLARMLADAIIETHGARMADGHNQKGLVELEEGSHVSG
jgi:ribose-phosphate pyrophosphokinase